MATKTGKIGSAYILYDDAIIENGASLDFDASLQTSLSGGRGRIAVMQGDSGPWVLRHYRRGGLIGKVIRDSYFWTGLQRTRAWREWHLLFVMYRQGLPVPRPVAARVRRYIFYYRADLLTCQIQDANTLADMLGTNTLTSGDWRTIGASIARFHQHGVYHADLNAHNILRDKQGRWYLIDFDRARRFGHTGTWAQSNLKRLRRSLQKIVKQDEDKLFSEADWGWLLTGYHKAGD